MKIVAIVHDDSPGMRIIHDCVPPGMRRVRSPYWASGPCLRMQMATLLAVLGNGEGNFFLDVGTHMFLYGTLGLFL